MSGTGRRRVIRNDALVAGAYLLLTLLVVAIEVLAGAVGVARALFFAGSAAFLAGLVGVHVASCKRYSTSAHLLWLLIFLLVTPIVAIIGGVNFKILIGGTF